MIQYRVINNELGHPQFYIRSTDNAQIPVNVQNRDYIDLNKQLLAGEAEIVTEDQE
jgi:hypothetical protein